MSSHGSLQEIVSTVVDDGWALSVVARSVEHDVQDVGGDKRTRTTSCFGANKRGCRPEKAVGIVGRDGDGIIVHVVRSAGRHCSMVRSKAL